jgi:hypothetical protein
MSDSIKDKIQSLLDHHRTMTVATVRPDGWPQATTVGYANGGFELYFLCALDSQKAANLALDDRVSVTINDDTAQVMEITGLSMAAHAKAVTDPVQAEAAVRSPADVAQAGRGPRLQAHAHGDLIARLHERLWAHRPGDLLMVRRGKATATCV